MNSVSISHSNNTDETTTATTKDRRQSSGNSSSSSSSGGGGRNCGKSSSITIVCPVCTRPTLIDRNLGVGMLKPNYDLRDAIQHLNMKKCGNECGREADVGCRECKTVFCSECLVTVHKMPFMKHHTTVPIEQLEQYTHKICPTHQIESNVFCKTCSSLACLMCYSFGDHKDHDCLPVHEYADACRREIDQLHDVINSLSIRAARAIELVRQEIESISRVRDDNNRVINEEFDRLVEKVNERRLQLVAQNQKVFETKNGTLQQQCRALQVIHQKTVDIVSKPVSSRDPFTLTGAKQKIALMISELNNDALFKPCYSSKLHMSVDIHNVVHDIASLGRISSTANSPDRPLTPTVQFKNGSLLISYQEPAYNGSPITEYVLYGRKNDEQFDVLYRGLDMSYSVTHLVRGKYEFKVSAVNSVGESPHSAIASYETKLTQFTYQSDFDTNGFLYWIGTSGGTKEYSNPALDNKIEVTRSSNDPSGRDDVRYAAGREVKRCLTNNSPNQWYMFDLREYSISPTHYSIQNWETGSHTLRNWELQGSNDAKTWVTLKEHKNDASLVERKGSTASWPIDPVEAAFRYFRIYQTGKNSSGNDYLMLSGFEIYGTVFDK